MDEKSFKQRIVGAIVLVALAVIFIPMLLPGDRDDFTDFGPVIPDKPASLEDMQILEIDKPLPAPPAPTQIRRPVDEATPANDRPDAVIPPAAPPATSAEPAAPVAKPDPEAVRTWAVQVGSFSKQANALRLRDKLRGRGYPAFVEKISTAGKVVYRVRVGPEAKRADALALQKELQQKMKLKGLVVRHP